MTRLSTLTRLAVTACAFGLGLAACASPSPSAVPSPQVDGTIQPSSPASTPTASATPAPTALPALALDPGVLKGVKLTFVHPWSGETRLAIERITAEFNQQNIWGVKVDLASPGSAGEEFGLVAGAIRDGGILPQVAAASPDHAAAWEKAQPEVIVDLAPFVGDPEWGMKVDEIADFNPQIWDQTISNGRQTGIPAQRSLQVLVYNLTWGRELGFSEPPASPEDFKQQICVATQANLLERKEDLTGTGGYILSTDPNTQLTWMAAFGFDPSGLDETAGYNFEGVPSEASFTYIRDLFNKSCAWISRNPLPFEYFAHRQTLVYAAGMGDLPAQEMAMRLAGSTDSWTVIPFPGPEGRGAALQTGLNYVILDSNPPEELASWLFIRWLMLPRNQAELARAGSSLPLSGAAMDSLQEYGDTHPQWLAAAGLREKSVPAPAEPSWRVVRGVLEDASWQLLQPTLQPIPEILKMLDETIPEVIK